VYVALRTQDRVAGESEPALQPPPRPSDTGPVKLQTRIDPDPAPPRRRPRRLTIEGVWAALPVLVPALVALMSTMNAIDLAYHIRAGELILTSHAIPRVDTFTFTVRGAPWLDQQWGAQLLMALAHRAGGWATLSVLRALLIGGSFGLIYRACRARGAAPAAASLLSLAGFVGSLQTLSMRPQLFAVPLFAATLLVLVERREHPRRLWWIPVMAVCWANLHGSFVMAPALVGLAFLEDLIRHDRVGAKQLLLVGLATMGATVITPFGWHVWSYAIEISTNPVIRKSITEWAPITLGTFAGVTFFVSAAAIATWLALRGEKTAWPDLMWLLVFFFLTLPALRGVIWWGLVAPVVVAGLLPLRWRARAAEAGTARGGSPVLNLTVVAVLLTASVMALPFWRDSGPTALLTEAPQGLVEAADAHLPPGTRLVVPQPWGSWFEYALPSMPVFVDARIELYPASVWQDFSTLHAAQDGWREVLDRWKVQAIVVDPRDWPLATLLPHDAGWRLVYRDADGELFVRS
jgi:hypothetical protein